MQPRGWAADAAVATAASGKRSSSITLKSKDTNLPVIVSKKCLQNDKKLP